MSKKKKQKYPAGWDEKRTRKLAEYYDNQTEDEQVAEHEAAFSAKGQTRHGRAHRVGPADRQAYKQETAGIAGALQRIGRSAFLG